MVVRRHRNSAYVRPVEPAGPAFRQGIRCRTCGDPIFRSQGARAYGDGFVHGRGCRVPSDVEWQAYVQSLLSEPPSGKRIAEVARTLAKASGD